MNRFEKSSNPLKWIFPILLAAVMTACGGGQKSILGTSANAVLAPTVINITPANNLTGVTVHNPVINATFNEAVAPLENGASFVVSCASPCSTPEGTVAFDSSGKVATFTPAANLTANTLYTATVTGAKSLATGVALESPYIWQFTTGIAPPPITVTATAPGANAAGVSINTSILTADFNEAAAPITGDASFRVTCASPCTNPSGTVTRDATDKIAIFTLAPGTSLEPLTAYTATITGATSLATGAPLATPYVWNFTTGALADTTRPRVILTVPETTLPGPTVGVPTNMAISATFSENMAPATIAMSSFTLTCSAPCVNPAGDVSYSVGTKTADFTPDMPLAANTTYTARITTAATDLATNALAGNQAVLPNASDYVWTFTTTTAAVAANASVDSTNPAANAVNVCPGASINATFDVPSGLRMSSASVNSTTFTVIEAATLTPVVATSVLLDVATGRIATFSPMNDLIVGKTYTATLKGGNTGVKDAAIPANTMSADFTWDFTVATCLVNPPAAIPLGVAATFGTFGGSAGATNQGINTVINGDIGTTAASTALTGFHDGGVGCTYTETDLNVGTVNGKIYTSGPPPTVDCPTEGTAETAEIAADARADALIAYNALVAKPGGPDPGAGNLASLVLVPGVYTALAGSFMIEGGDLTLDAQGDANAVWVFQMASTLTVGGPGAAAPQSVLLVNGAQAKNVFWQVGTAATINAGGGGTMVGTIISQAGSEISTDGNVAVVTLNGRVLSLNASVTMVNTVINVPAN